MKSRILLSLVSLGIALILSNCGTSFVNGDKIVVSVRDQKMVVLRHGEPVKAYKISTSKFGLGDQPGSNRTPLGRMKIAKKIGDGQPAGAVFKSRRPTGEVIEPNAPGRDPIVSRILWLTGTESNNRNAFRRYIYIHGTPEVCRLGQPASYGCIRMGTKDVVDLYNRIHTGAEVYVIRGSLSGTSIQKNFTAAR
jgi:lipoprotein-anchoring transpeptidase ErfK/SrfK